MSKKNNDEDSNSPLDSPESSEDNLSFEFDKSPDPKGRLAEQRKQSDITVTHMSKSVNFARSLQYLDGDVTITDKYGQIRGTFIKTHENSSIKEMRSS